MKENKTPPQPEPKPNLNSKNFDMFFEFDRRLTKDFIPYLAEKDKPVDGYVFLAIALDLKDQKKCGGVVNVHAEKNDIIRLLLKGAEADQQMKEAVIAAGAHLSSQKMNISEILHKIITRNNGENQNAANLLASGRGLAANIDTGEVQEIPLPQGLIEAFERARERGVRRRPGIRRLTEREQVRRNAIISISYKKCD